jgi:hypothetical protein
VVKLFRVLVIATAALISSTSAQAGVVLQLSNMGSSGNSDTSTGLNQDQNTLRIGAGFTTGLTALTVKRISVVLFGASLPQSVLVRLGIYDSTGGNPNLASEVAFSEVTVSDRGVVPFTFNTTLSASTLYYVAVSTNASWYINGASNSPTPQNRSDWTFTGYKQNSGSGWSSSSLAATLAIFSEGAPSVVPEPALTSLLCLGGVTLIRRRMKK